MKRMFIALLFSLTLAGPIATAQTLQSWKVRLCVVRSAGRRLTGPKWNSEQPKTFCKAKSCVERDPTLLGGARR
jgi:hypothetical protein